MYVCMIGLLTYDAMMRLDGQRVIAFQLPGIPKGCVVIDHASRSWLKHDMSATLAAWLCLVSGLLLVALNLLRW